MMVTNRLSVILNIPPHDYVYMNNTTPYLFSLTLISALLFAGCQSTEPTPAASTEAEPMEVVVLDMPTLKDDLIPAEVVEIVEPVAIAVEPPTEPEMIAPDVPVSAVVIAVAEPEPAIPEAQYEPVDLPKGVRASLDEMNAVVGLSAEQYHEIELIFAERSLEYKALLKQKSQMEPQEFDQEKSKLFSSYYKKYTPLLTTEQRKAWSQRERL
jgi:hypothetical protein